ncbi:CusA/CzcA family heavy metal efflux RND transporter [Nitrospirillum sp. BR 11163]|uniref:efflux RND transporter permease subunit n=1 Tax=Nitrospirillum sp. BR 11163 TaxID=3104323 RepID=UPI002AFFE7A3|nr:CusA/CzcA family heavy metal efflux RND transporter [Nitrospirillum sp. BR 11163]MEA1675038.1 CusA/CzcA family heavy metal efflux RND transporter [Nitrospirillum sp. BR 11163]
MNKVVIFALRQRVLMLAALAALLVVGVGAFLRLNIEAYPDPVPPMVEIVTQNSGQSAEEIERYITVPIEVQMAGIPHVTAIRSVSLFGLSDIKIQFTYDFTYDEAVQRVINQLSQLSNLPSGVQPAISPESPIGEILRYQVVGPPGYSVTDLKTLQDWVLQRRFKAVPGVIDVSGWGGKTKAYEVTVDQRKLTAYGLTIPGVLQALNNANINVGGQTVNIGDQAMVVRGVGQIHSLDDIRGTVLAANNGTPVLVGDVATVTVGNQPRLGIAGRDGQDDIVQGIVLMRRGAESKPTILAAKAEMEKINTSGILPPGVYLKTIYDRSDLIDLTTHTVLHNMVMGIVLIFFVQWLFLGDLRSAVIVAATVPFALFFAILIMTLRGESANLLSVGAIDFGLIVDATVIMVENIFRHLAQPPKERFAKSSIMHSVRQEVILRGRFGVIANSAVEVNRAIFFSAAIIIAGFVPLFTLSGVEGHIFGPMAKTYAYAIAGGLIATFTISPALSAILLPEQVRERDTVVVRALHRLYPPLLRLALANRRLVLAVAGALMVLAIVCTRFMGMEFLPHLEEGNLWIRANLPLSISLEAGTEAVDGIRRIIKDYPEVETVISQHGRPDDGTDATGFFNAEFFVPLKPFDSWPKGWNKERLTRDIEAKLTERFPGIEFNFSQYIEDNVEEAASGVKGENSVKLFGNDLETLEKTANRIKQVMSTVPGVTDLGVFKSLGQPTIKITVDRAKAARYGLSTGDVNAVVQAAIGGQAAGNLYEDGSDRNFPIMVRLSPEDRGSLDAIRHITVGTTALGTGTAPIPLADVADIRMVSGASFIYREGQGRYIPIKFSVRGRDLGSAVLEAQQKVAEQVQLPGGYRLEWVGEFGNLQDAVRRLAVAVPVSLALICVLLYLNFASMTDTLLAASVMPMALIGGIFILAATGTPFSISAAIGFIGLFGISVMEGIIVISYFNQLVHAGMERAAALVKAAETRLRPVMMTCIAACVGLLPAALSHGIGSQVQRPLAMVVVGGILLAPILILVVLPALISLFSSRTALPMQDGPVTAGEAE